MSELRLAKKLKVGEDHVRAVIRSDNALDYERVYPTGAGLFESYFPAVNDSLSFTIDSMSIIISLFATILISSGYFSVNLK